MALNSKKIKDRSFRQMVKPCTRIDRALVYLRSEATQHDEEGEHSGRRMLGTTVSQTTQMFQPSSQSVSPLRPKQELEHQLNQAIANTMNKTMGVMPAFKDVKSKSKQFSQPTLTHFAR